MATSSFEIILKSKDAAGNPLKVENGYLSKAEFEALWGAATTSVIDFETTGTPSGDACKFEIGATQFLFVKAEDDNYICLARLNSSTATKVGVLKSVLSSSKYRDVFGDPIPLVVSMHGGVKTSISKAAFVTAGLIPTARGAENHFNKNVLPCLKTVAKNYTTVKKNATISSGSSAGTFVGGIYKAPAPVGGVSPYTVYLIERPRGRNQGDDTDLAYLVVSKHPRKSGEKSCYYIENIFDASGNIVDCADPAKIFAAGGKVVNRGLINVTQKGMMRIKLYKEDKEIDKKLVKALTPATVPEINAELGKPVEKISPDIRGFAKKIGIGIAIVTTIATGITGVLHSQMYMGEYQGEAAREHGTKIVRSYQQPFFNYKDGTVAGIAQGTLDLFNDTMVIYEHQGFLGRMNKTFMSGYRTDTLDSYFQELGRKVATELNENEIRIISPVVSEGNQTEVTFKPVYSYLISSYDSDISNPEIMKGMIMDSFGLTEEEANAAIESYQKGFSERCQEIVAENPELKDNTTQSEPPIEIPPVVDEMDFEGADILNCIYSEISEVDSRVMKDEMKIEYASLTDGKIFVSSGNYLYEMEINQDGLSEVDTNEEYVQAITGNVLGLERGIRADFAFKNIPGVTDFLQEWLKPYNESAVAYVSRMEPQLSEDGLHYEFAPVVTVVYENEDGVVCVDSFEADGVVKVAVDDLGGKVSMVSSNAVALFNYDFGVVDTTGKMIYQNNSDARAWRYNENSIPAEVVEDEAVVDPVEDEISVDETVVDEKLVENKTKKAKVIAEKIKD